MSGLRGAIIFAIQRAGRPLSAREIMDATARFPEGSIRGTLYLNEGTLFVRIPKSRTRPRVTWDLADPCAPVAQQRRS